MEDAGLQLVIIMNKELTNENILIEKIKKTFSSADVSIQREKRVIVKIAPDTIPPLLSYAKDYLDFKHLSHISYVDWIEENEFELVFILWSYELQIQIIAKTRINREIPKFTTITKLWRQAETYEREIHEMYGIEFEGNDRMGEFLLEDWEDIPPMRRDFNTREFVKENIPDRSAAREDGKNVRETIAKHSGEDIPEFAKKYQTRNIDE